MENLVNPFGAGQIAQPHRPQITKRDGGRQALLEEDGHCLRQQYLAAVGDAHDPGSAIDRLAVEIVVAALVNAGVQPAAHAKDDASGCFGVSQIPLQIQRRVDCIERIVESGVDAVACYLDDCTAVPRHGCLGNRVVPRQSRPHPFGFLLP